MVGKVSRPFDEAKYMALLEGLHVAELKLSELIKEERLDAEFASHPKTKWLKKIQEKLIFKPLGSIVTHISSGHTPYKHDLSKGEIKFITVECISELTLHENKLKRITKEQYDKEFKKNRVVKNSVACTIKRRICKAYPFINNPIYPLAMNQDISFFKPNNEITAGYLATYLCSDIGQSFADRQKTEQMNPYISVKNLSNLPIAILKIDFQKYIDNIILKAYETRQTAQNLYTTAEAELLAALGLSDYQPSTENVQVKSLKDSFLSSGRLDAEYYQPKYEYVVNVIQNYEGGFARLKDFTTSYSTGFPFKSKSYSGEGFNLIRINNIKKGYLDIENAAKIPVKDTELSKRDIVKENDILLSMSGTIGNSCKIPKGVKAIINQRILKITPKNYDFDVLPLIINSIIGEYQLERIGTGGVQTNISGTDIFNIFIPILHEDLQKQIGDDIRRSFLLKNQSKHLLHLAQTGVEKAIESSEAEAMAWMEAEIGR